ncbi:SDR family oxidoreductase [Seongchinamella sediminis]|uniref:SDR family oxidoreductase n=1 Tax=Seongchinamella sediminis TaxID=2283635 RepID=A0A3L7DYY8_9GAMM|nr:SDR family oxidoreductase [Seongchinamella sediminis]RLQ22474.1 SDR family oxidoreductase [Seongchinamella sediminis]
MDLNGKLIVLTGASGGIGRAMAASLAGAGARLVLVGRDDARLEQLRATLPGAGHSSVAADLTTAAGRDSVVAACHGQLDLLVNNAGVNHFGLLEQQSDQQLQQMIEVNLLAPMLLTRALLPQLQARQGCVVNIGSGFGSIGFAGYCAYSASKFALRGFTEALRRELADSGVRVQYLAPRAVATDMNPPEVVALNDELGNRTDSPETVASELLALLASGKAARHIGGRERFFARLNSVFPGLVDAALGKNLALIKRRAMAVSSHAG